jgi:RNA polymerase sigma-70 factor, ECF subfamily
MTLTDTNRALDAVWRIESPRLIAGLARIVLDISLAEDLAQDALVAALEQWPKAGIPDNPGGWLWRLPSTVRSTYSVATSGSSASTRKLGYELAAKETAVPDLNAALDDNIGDDLRRLVFISCIPCSRLRRRLHSPCACSEVLRPRRSPAHSSSRSGPWHRESCGAKRSLTEAHVPFEVPRGPELAARLPSVLEVIDELALSEIGLLSMASCPKAANWAKPTRIAPAWQRAPFWNV